MLENKKAERKNAKLMMVGKLGSKTQMMMQINEITKSEENGSDELMHIESNQSIDSNESSHE